MYKYICKEDTEVAHSKNHSNLLDAKSPRTKNLSPKTEMPVPKGDLAASLMANKQQNRQKKRANYTNVANFLQQHEVRSYTE